MSFYAIFVTDDGTRPSKYRFASAAEADAYIAHRRRGGTFYDAPIIKSYVYRSIDPVNRAGTYESDEQPNCDPPRDPDAGAPDSIVAQHRYNAIRKSREIPAFPLAALNVMRSGKLV